MKYLISFCLMSFSFMEVTHASISIKELRLDNSWSIKYDSNIWSYKYLKAFSGISPHLFENKKENFKLILQKETHTKNNEDFESLTNAECSAANLFYQQNKSGSASVESINGIKTCYINYKNTSGKTVQEYVYPEKTKGRNYEIYTYVWSSENAESKILVQSFLKGFIK